MGPQLPTAPRAAPCAGAGAGIAQESAKIGKCGGSEWVKGGDSLLPPAGEGGAKRRMREVFQGFGLIYRPHPNPLSQAGEGAKIADASG